MEIQHAGLTLKVRPEVYPPAEDSFMLAKGATALKGSVLEIGCGCGLASLVCAKSFRMNSVLGVDINRHAVDCATDNARRNSIPNVRFSESDLFEKLEGLEFDAIMFNPPYLPTSEDEILPGELNRAYDGGADGRSVVDRFLDDFDSHIKAGGILLLIQSSLNGPEQTKDRLVSLGYLVSVEAEEKYFFEKLTLIKAVKL
jgi:release factor glutamine methyltransferase